MTNIFYTYVLSTLAKISLTGMNFLAVLVKDIPVESIPACLGGRLEESNEAFEFDISQTGPFYSPGKPTSLGHFTQAPIAKLSQDNLRQLELQSCIGSSQLSIGSHSRQPQLPPHHHQHYRQPKHQYCQHHHYYQHHEHWQSSEDKRHELEMDLIRFDALRAYSTAAMVKTAAASALQERRQQRERQTYLEQFILSNIISEAAASSGAGVDSRQHHLVSTEQQQQEKQLGPGSLGYLNSYHIRPSSVGLSCSTATDGYGQHYGVSYDPAEKGHCRPEGRVLIQRNGTIIARRVHNGPSEVTAEDDVASGEAEDGDELVSITNPPRLLSAAFIQQKHPMLTIGLIILGAIVVVQYSGLFSFVMFPLLLCIMLASLG